MTDILSDCCLHVLEKNLFSCIFWKIHHAPRDIGTFGIQRKYFVSKYQILFTFEFSIKDYVSWKMLILCFSLINVEKANPHLYQSSETFFSTAIKHYLLFVLFVIFRRPWKPFICNFRTFWPCLQLNLRASFFVDFLRLLNKKLSLFLYLLLFSSLSLISICFGNFLGVNIASHILFHVLNILFQVLSFLLKSSRKVSRIPMCEIENFIAEIDQDKQKVIWSLGEIISCTFHNIPRLYFSYVGTYEKICQ